LNFDAQLIINKSLSQFSIEFMNRFISFSFVFINFIFDFARELSFSSSETPS